MVEARRRCLFPEQPCPFQEDLEMVRELSEENRDAMELLNQRIDEISANTAHLSKLDAIANTLESVNTNLMGAAIGRKQIPLVSHLMMVGVLGAIILVVLLEKSEKELKLTASGFELKRPPIIQVAPVAPVQLPVPE